MLNPSGGRSTRSYGAGIDVVGDGTTVKPPQEALATNPLKVVNWPIAVFVLASIVYFADILIKARAKCFWFDELFTVYLCRLPSFKDTWSAVMHGTDFNPPLFYILVRGARNLFGDGPVGARLPAAIGVWIFCVALFWFTSKQAGKTAGLVAGLFPFFTLIQYYAYEARAHGLVLGWCGLALITWQKASRSRANSLWTLWFGLFIACALLTHVYTVYMLVAFGVVELRGFFGKERVRWGIIAALALSFALVAGFIYLPLVRAYRSAMPASFFPAGHDSVSNFLIHALSPAIVVFVLFILFSAVNWERRLDTDRHRTSAQIRELWLAVAFTCLPIVGLLGCKLSHGPFLDRYFLPSLAGWAILLGYAVSWQPLACRKALAACMCALIFFDLVSTIYLGRANRLFLWEPSSGLLLNTDPTNPMRQYETVATDRSGSDILVTSSLEYLHFFRYAPANTVGRLFYAGPPDDPILGGFEGLAKWAHVDLKITNFRSFESSRSRFLVYEAARSRNPSAIGAIVQSGFSVKSIRGDFGGTLYEFERTAPLADVKDTASSSH
jgi:hypothetical protein